MSKMESKITAHLTIQENEEIHKAMLKSLQTINQYFESPYAAHQNLAQEIKTANNVINSFAKIRQSETGFETTRTIQAKLLSSNLEELKKFFEDNLPQIEISKKLPEHKK